VIDERRNAHQPPSDACNSYRSLLDRLRTLETDTHRHMYEWALFAHLAGVISFFAGLAVAAVGETAARRRSRRSEIAALLGTARWGVVLVAAGLLLVGSPGSER
jgi:hypothetical protein